MIEKVILGGLSSIEKRRVDVLQQNTMADMVFLLIWRAHQISRAEIAKRIGLSRSTVTEIIKTLVQTDFVAEVGVGQSGGGRRPIVLEFQDQARVILGVDIGATHVSVALTDLRGTVLDWQEAAHPVRTDPEGTRELIIKLCNASLAKKAHHKQRLLSIGVAVPSPVDPLHPERLSESVLPSWGGRHGLENLEKYYEVPVKVDNDANLGALAEQRMGAGLGLDHIMFIKIGYGIGAGYILGGEIYRGAVGSAGEIGHLPIDPNATPCGCGLRGCLGNFIGVPALEARTETLRNDYSESILASDIPLTITAIEDAALAGDALAMRVVREATEYLGTALASVCNLMNPNMVILGGGLSRLDEVLLNPLREKLESCTLVRSATPDVQVSQLGPRAVAVGAATLALEDAFAKNLLLQD